ncbi:MAG: rhodanese-like domain-containing protein [Prosthecobacter sp.]
MKTIDRTELERWANEQRAFALVDVLPDDPACAHLAAAMPHAHSRADFMSQMARLEAHKEQPVVLYEASSASVRSGAAADMLEQAGFDNVYRFVGPQSAIHASAHGLPSESQSA